MTNTAQFQKYPGLSASDRTWYDSRKQGPEGAALILEGGRVVEVVTMTPEVPGGRFMRCQIVTWPEQ